MVIQILQVPAAQQVVWGRRRGRRELRLRLLEPKGAVSVGNIC